MRIIFILALFLPAMVTAQSLSQKSTLSFMMITQRLAEDPFWGVVEDIAIAASKDFDIDLHIRHAESDRSNLLKFVDEAAKSKLDAVIFPNFKNVAPEIIELAEKLEIPVFLFNAGVLSKNLPRTGKPREKFKFWIGESLPNDEFAGFLLAKTLIAQAKQQNLFDANGIVQIVGITGTVSEMPSLLRKQGLERAVREDKRALLNQVVFGLERIRLKRRLLLIASFVIGVS